MILASQVWTQIFWTSALAGGLLAGVPIMFTALGESISERAGVLNIGLEGMMLAGAYCGFLGAYYGHTQWLGYLAGVGAGMVRCRVHRFNVSTFAGCFAVRPRSDPATETSNGIVQPH